MLLQGEPLPVTNLDVTILGRYQLSAVSVALEYNAEYKFEAGTTYSLTCLSDGQRDLVCKSADGQTHKFSYGGTNNATANPDYWGGSAKCHSTATTLTTDYDIWCKHVN